MTGEAVISANGVGIVNLHFNVESHYIALEIFKETASSIADLIKSFDDTIFSGNLDHEMVILPPRAGTFLSSIGFVISTLGVGAGILNALDTDIVKGFVRGATGHDPAYYAEKAGIKLSDYLSGKHRKARNELTGRETSLICDITSAVATGFLSKDYLELRKYGFTIDQFKESYGAKNRFYSSCHKHREIKSVGFDEKHHFPISRSDFPRFIIEISDSASGDDNAEWTVEIISIQVTSPNWDKKDKQRMWKGKPDHEKAITFSVEDENFWHLVESKSMSTEIMDTLKVQLAFIKDDEKRKSARALRIIEMNGKFLSNPLTDKEISTILGKYTATAPREPDLFSMLLL